MAQFRVVETPCQNPFFLRLGIVFFKESAKLKTRVAEASGLKLVSGGLDLFCFQGVSEPQNTGF